MRLIASLAPLAAALPHAPPPLLICWRLLSLLLTLFANPLFPPPPHHPHPRVPWHHRDITSQSGSNFFTLVGLVSPLASFSQNHSWDSGLVLFFHQSAKSPSTQPQMVLLLGSPHPANPVSHLGRSGCLGKGNLGHHSTSSPESAPPLWAGGATAPLRLHRDPLVSQCQSVSGGSAWVPPPLHAMARHHPK